MLTPASEGYKSAADGWFAPGATQMLITRENAPVPRFPLLERMVVERGTKADWDLLHDLHYKAESLPIGPRFWKLTLDGQTIGVIVTSNPKGLLKERHLIFPRLKITGEDTQICNTQRYKFVNSNFRVVARFVIDTMYRGIGAGYRMQNIVSRMEGNTYMEIQSSMSKFNLFGQKAGFRFAKLMNSTKFESGIKFLRSNFQANPQDFEAIVTEVENKTPEEQAIILQHCKEFYAKNSVLEKTGRNREKGPGRIAAMNLRQTIKAVQQLILASPMYGIWKNPDPKRPIPHKLPLVAFDWQGPEEPFNFAAYDAWAKEHADGL